MAITLTGRKSAAAPERKKRGRPSGYEPRFAEIALGYTILGATNANLAELFGVSLERVTDWLVQFPDFRAAVDEGRVQADLRVARSFYRRAVGYTATTRRVETATGPDGQTRTCTTEVETHVPADTNAAWRWLQLRCGWRLPTGSELTVDDVIRFAKMARAEAARRGIDYNAHSDESEEPEEPDGTEASRH